MKNEYVRLIDSYREPEDNEFFFTRDPKAISTMRDMLDYLEENFNLRFEKIEPWKIKTTLKDHNHQYDRIEVGYRIVRTDES